MASSYVGRGFGHVNAAAAVAPSNSTVQAPARMTLPPLFDVAVPPRETTDDFPTSINDMYRRQQQPRESEDHRDRRSESSSRSSHSRHSHRSSGSERDDDDEDEPDRRRHSSSYDRYEEDEPTPRKTRETEPEEAFYDDRYLWATGFFLLLVAVVYFYWLNVYDCCAGENEETNMTMQYAIDQFTRKRLAVGVSPASAVDVEGEQPGETGEGA